MYEEKNQDKSYGRLYCPKMSTPIGSMPHSPFIMTLTTLPSSERTSMLPPWTQADLFVTDLLMEHNRSKAVWLPSLGQKNSLFFYVLLLGHLLCKSRHLDMRSPRGSLWKGPQEGTHTERNWIPRPSAFPELQLTTNIKLPAMWVSHSRSESSNVQLRGCYVKQISFPTAPCPDCRFCAT